MSLLIKFPNIAMHLSEIPLDHGDSPVVDPINTLR